MIKNIIVAVSDNWVIGKDNKMPWYVPDDLKWFKKQTTGHPVIMGANTYKSIGKPLPNRTNIVVTHKYIGGVICVRSIKEAYSVAEKLDNQCFIIGGASLYKECINDADCLYVTHIHTVIDDGDTFFPEIDESVWEMESLTPYKIDETSNLGYNFAIYKRR